MPHCPTASLSHWYTALPRRSIIPRFHSLIASLFYCHIAWVLHCPIVLPFLFTFPVLLPHCATLPYCSLPFCSATDLLFYLTAPLPQCPLLQYLTVPLPYCLTAALGQYSSPPFPIYSNISLIYCLTVLLPNCLYTCTVPDCPVSSLLTTLLPHYLNAAASVASLPCSSLLIGLPAPLSAASLLFSLTASLLNCHIEQLLHSICSGYWEGGWDAP